MLYLFGRLALSDSFYFNQDLQQDEYQELIAHDEHPEEPSSDAASLGAAPPSPAALRLAPPAQSPAPYPARQLPA